MLETFIKLKETLDPKQLVKYTDGNYIINEDASYQPMIKKYKILDPTGKLKIVETYKNGKLDGPYKIFDPTSGNLILIKHYKNGNLNGPYREYHDGKIIEERNYKNNKLDGPFIYKQAGTLIEREYYDGIMIEEKQYHNDILQKESEYDIQGQPILIRIYDYKDPWDLIEETIYYENRYIKDILSDGSIVETEEKYYDQPTTKHTVYYDNVIKEYTLPDGSYTLYDYDGNIIEEGV